MQDSGLQAQCAAGKVQQDLARDIREQYLDQQSHHPIRPESYPDRRRLESGFHPDGCAGSAVYLVLVSGDTTGDLRFHRDLFLESLKPHVFQPATLEVEFRSGITLNISSVYRDPAVIPARLDRIFVIRRGNLQTSYTLWQVGDALRKTSETVEPNDIPGHQIQTAGMDLKRWLTI